MAWETALDRLVTRQVHCAESGDARPEDVRAAIVEMRRLDPDRPETAFHLGYARALLGLDLPQPSASEDAARRL